MTDEKKNKKGTDHLPPDEVEQRAEDIAMGLFSGVRKPLNEYVGKHAVPKERGDDSR